MREFGKYLPRVLVPLILASCNPVVYPENPAPPPATSSVPSATLQPEANDYQLSPTREERIYDQILFDTREFLTSYVKSRELHECILPVLEKQQFLEKLKKSPNGIEDSFVMAFGVKKPDGTPRCSLELYYESNDLRAVNLVVDLLSLNPNRLAPFTNNESLKSIPNDRLTEVAEATYNISLNAKWKDANFAFSQTINHGKIASDSETGVSIEISIFEKGQSSLFIAIPKVGSKL